jgi:hypothetical protein
MNMQKLCLSKIFVSYMLCMTMLDYVHKHLVAMNLCESMLVESVVFFNSHCACISFSSIPP